jgi:dihydrofolate reductase
VPVIAAGRIRARLRAALADALLLGRKTWEIWEPYWPNHDSGDPVSHGINVLPKYVPSTTLKNPTWQNTHVIEGDFEAAVLELERGQTHDLELIESRSTPSGVMLQTYRPAGRATFGTVRD